MSSSLHGLRSIEKEQTAERIYKQLHALAGAMPDFRAGDAKGAVPEKTLRWLGEVSGVISEMDLPLEAARLDAAIERLIRFGGATSVATSVGQLIMAIIFKCLSVAQQRSPATTQSAFIATGADFDAFAALQKIFTGATRTILIVDPYMDETALTDFAVLANEPVSIRLLTDAEGMRPALVPAAKKWIEQYGGTRPLLVAKANARSLHDRLLLIDDDQAWIMTQSLKDFAARSPATIQKTDDQLARMKFEAYTQIWNASEIVAE